jgi:hypothetical protein
LILTQKLFWFLYRTPLIGPSFRAVPLKSEKSQNSFLIEHIEGFHAEKKKMTFSNTLSLIENGLLLAVDTGVKTGLALYGKPDRLIWYRSHNMGSLSSLRKAANHLIHSIEGLSVIVTEGGGPVADAWNKEGLRIGIQIISTDAGEWRKELLYPREYRNSEKAKQTAIFLSRQIIEKSEAPSENFPAHDAAEAILIGLWGCKKAGWIDEVPKLFR